MKIARTVLMLFPVAGFAAEPSVVNIVWQGALPSPAAEAAPAPEAVPAPDLALVSAPLPPEPVAVPTARAPVVTGALVDLPDAIATADNLFGLGAGLRHYFEREQAVVTPYIGLDAGVRPLENDAGLADTPFNTPSWQPNVGIRAGLTYPVSSRFDLGIASGLYYQSEALTPDRAVSGTGAASASGGDEGLLVPLSVRGRMRF